MRAGKLIVVIALLAAASTAANAREVFRCNGSIIDTGMTAPAVLAKCGEPDYRDVESIPVRARNAAGGTYVVGTSSLEHWLYNRAPGQWPAYLTFDQGRLRSIEFLDRL